MSTEATDPESEEESGEDIGFDQAKLEEMIQEAVVDYLKNVLSHNELVDIAKDVFKDWLSQYGPDLLALQIQKKLTVIKKEDAKAALPRPTKKARK